MGFRSGHDVLNVGLELVGKPCSRVGGVHAPSFRDDQVSLSCAKFQSRASVEKPAPVSLRFVSCTGSVLKRLGSKQLVVSNDWFRNLEFVVF